MGKVGAKGGEVVKEIGGCEGSRFWGDGFFRVLAKSETIGEMFSGLIPGKDSWRFVGEEITNILLYSWQ